MLQALPLAAAATGLPSGLASSLGEAGIPESSVAVLVMPLDGGEPLLARNADKPMNPASVMKLATSAAALEVLGPAYTWTTRLSAQKEAESGVLAGPLYLTGSGDPVLTTERLWLLLQDLRARGVKRIAGDVVTDRSALRLPPYDPGAFDGKPLRAYNAGADALTLDYNALRVRLLPGPAQVSATIAPAVSGLAIANALQVAPGPCTDPLAGLNASAQPNGSTTRLVLTGSLPADCRAPLDWELAPLPPARLLEGMFRSLWAELGGELDGRFIDGLAPPDAIVLAKTESPPLAAVLREMNKWSNNVIARLLLATLGANAEPGADSVAAGGRAMLRSLAALGVPTDGMVIENGAGLSRRARISASQLGSLLRAAWQRRWMPELMASLPVAGVDGTARKRALGTQAAGSAHVKTGSLDGVRTMAGYVLGQSGRRYAVVLLVNHPNAAAARFAQDALLAWAAQQ
ncbi:MAG: D-alanyl-D-alanine carboxypeptidase/D-alanyl-D-alanine-endopeptidase [Zoogloea sp.]|nr:D-alanyl-D-alanine carboxypeptidase/D-alanyl-D-alanine-endopeptidase [Zoogloea sp.]